METSLKNLNNRKQILNDITKYISYVLFAGVILVVLQGFFSLALLGTVRNTTSNNSHFMHYTQFYLKFCAMLLTVVLLMYYGIKTYIVFDEKRYSAIGKFIKSNIMLLPLGLMLIWAFISLFHSPDFEKSLYGSGYINEGFFTVLEYAVVFLSAYAIRQELKISKMVILWTFVIMAGLICFIMWGALVVDYNFGTTKKTGVFNNSNHYGYFLAMSTTATFALLVYSKKDWQVALLAVLLALNVHNLLYCNTLGANFAFIGGIIFIICSGAMTKKIRWMNLIIAFFVTGLVVFIDEVVGISKMWKQYVSFFEDLGILADSATGGSSDPNLVGTGRYSLWKRTIAVIKQVPWFGKGMDLYYANNIYDKRLDVPHNEYLAMASNIGIPGLVLYLVMIIWWFAKAVYQKDNMSIIDLSIMAGAFAYLISAFTGNSFTYTYPYFLVFYAMSMQPTIPKEKRYKKLQTENTPDAIENRTALENIKSE